MSEHLISHSLRSLCPVTAQPDWGSLSIRYTGQPIDHASVSAYLSAYRSHQGFHEQCVDQIYTDLMTLAPASLQVVAFYQRRGGVDITPWRSTEPLSPRSPAFGAAVATMPFRRISVGALLGALVCVCAVFPSEPSRSAPGLTEVELKAVFLLRLPQFVSWPDQRPASTFCITDASEVSTLLTDMVASAPRGRTVRSISYRRY